MRNAKTVFLVLGIAALALIFAGVGLANATPPKYSKAACQEAYPSIAEYCKDKDINCVDIPKEKHGFPLATGKEDVAGLDANNNGFGCDIETSQSAKPSVSAPTGVSQSPRTPTLPVTGSNTPIFVGIGLSVALAGLIVLFVARKKRDEEVVFVTEDE